MKITKIIFLKRATMAKLVSKLKNVLHEIIFIETYIVAKQYIGPFDKTTIT